MVNKDPFNINIYWQELQLILNIFGPSYTFFQEAGLLNFLQYSNSQDFVFGLQWQVKINVMWT